MQGTSSESSISGDRYTAHLRSSCQDMFHGYSIGSVLGFHGD